MKTFVELECIGWNSAKEIRGFAKFMGEKPPANLTPWVAELTGPDPTSRYSRTYIRSNLDFSRANSKGSRGVYSQFFLEEGKIYIVHQFASWDRVERDICKIINGELVVLEAYSKIEGMIDCLEREQWLHDQR